MRKPNKKKDFTDFKEQLANNLENISIDETLETLDKSSPRLNWLYLILVALFFSLVGWLVWLNNGHKDADAWVDQASEVQSLKMQVDTLEEKVDRLQSQIESSHHP